MNQASVADNAISPEVTFELAAVLPDLRAVSFTLTARIPLAHVDRFIAQLAWNFGFQVLIIPMSLQVANEKRSQSRLGLPRCMIGVIWHCVQLQYYSAVYLIYQPVRSLTTSV